jgi:hypothetical protein
MLDGARNVVSRFVEISLDLSSGIAYGLIINVMT